MAQSLFAGIGHDFIGVLRMATNQYQGQVLGQMVEGTDGQHGIFAGFDGANLKNEPLRQTVKQPYLFTLLKVRL